jgi:hypothetical protein
MPTDTLDAPVPHTTTADVPACHALHVKAVPYEVWCRARHNANLSRMTLRDYVIRLLAEAQPYPFLPPHVVAQEHTAEPAPFRTLRS